METVPRQIAWQVLAPLAEWNAFTVIDKVFFDRDCDADCVRRTLIEHDGFPADIKVALDNHNL